MTLNKKFTAKSILGAVSVFALTGCAIPAVNDAIMGGPTAPVVASKTSPNPYGITGTLDMKDAASLRASLENMIGGLGQNDQMAFMEAFFRVAQMDRCDETGEWRKLGNSLTGGRKSFGSCARTAYDVQYFPELARGYVADKRLDVNYAYKSSNAFGTRTGGSSASESYVNFITLYGDVMDGRDANYINWRNSAIMRRKAVSQRGQY